MKSKVLIVSLAVCLMMSAITFAGNCATCDDCNACNACCTQKCDLFGGLKNLLACKPLARHDCGPCNAVVACAPCEPACAPICDPCEPVCCDTGCGFNYGCNDRPLLRASHTVKRNVSKFFSGLFGSLRGCNCALCSNHCCNACTVACDPCEPACFDPCAPACCGNGHSQQLPAAPNN